MEVLVPNTKMEIISPSEITKGMEPLSSSEISAEMEINSQDFSVESHNIDDFSSCQVDNDQIIDDVNIVEEGVPAGILSYLASLSCKISPSSSKFIFSNLGFCSTEIEFLAKRIESQLVPEQCRKDTINFVCSLIAEMLPTHPKYGLLAARLCCYYNHRMLQSKNFLQRLESLEKRRHVDDEFYKFVSKNLDVISDRIDYSRDNKYDYFGLETFRSSYVPRDLITGEDLMSPQDVLMGVSLSINRDDISVALDVYDNVSRGAYTFATPTLANAMFGRLGKDGKPSKRNMSSCFLLSIVDDSIEGMYEDVVVDMTKISAAGGGISCNVDVLRAKGSLIHGSGGKTTGIVPYLKTHEQVGIHVNQGNVRRGAICDYMSTWHADILDFMKAGCKHGADSTTAKQLNYGICIDDLLYERARTGENWSLFDPATARDLHKVQGKNFIELYLKYEREGRAVATINSQELLAALATACIEQGSCFTVIPEVIAKTANQKNLGKVYFSNLCTEISQFVGIDIHGEHCTPICVLSSVSLPYFIRDCNFDYRAFMDIIREMVRNLNKIIDVQSYPTKNSERTSMKNRSIGIGIQGLADLFLILGLSFTSPRARQLNRKIQECLYYAAVDESCNLAMRIHIKTRAEVGFEQSGEYQFFGAHETYSWGIGTDLKRGIFHFDHFPKAELSGLCDWDSLRSKVAMYGTRNSTFCANMPTASTSQILGNNECFEPYTSNIYTRTILNGKYMIVNKHLVKYLEEKGLWNETIKNEIVKDGGSVQNLSCLNSEEKEMFRTAYEIPVKHLIEMDGERQWFVDQSQSSNRHMVNPTLRDFLEMLYCARANNLKTASYYLRTKMDKPTSSTDYTSKPALIVSDGDICTMEEGCLVCSS